MVFHLPRYHSGLASAAGATATFIRQINRVIQSKIKDSIATRTIEVVGAVSGVDLNFHLGYADVMLVGIEKIVIVVVFIFAVVFVDKLLLDLRIDIVAVLFDVVE